MSTYQVQRGDTLGTLARRNHTTVSALMKANPSIHNANTLHTGQHLAIPGNRDEFVSHGHKPTTSHTTPSRSTPSTANGTNPDAIAHQYVGVNARDLKVSNNAVGRAMHDNVPNTENCANFVSACLQAAGQIPTREHSDSAAGLSANLDRDSNFRRVSLSNAKPGDVVLFKTAHGHHIVMFDGFNSNGSPRFIGSNNINRDGTQQVSVRSMGYSILAIHHYVG